MSVVIYMPQFKECCLYFLPFKAFWLFDIVREFLESPKNTPTIL